MNWKWILLGSGIAIGLIASLFLIIKINADKNEALAKQIRAAAYEEGAQSVNLDAAKKGYELLASEVARVARLQEESGNRVIEIRKEYRDRIIEIDRYDDSIAITRPEEVEAWANKTTNDLFKSIEEETKK